MVSLWILSILFILPLVTPQFRETCFCPPTDEHPDIEVDGSSACPPGDKLAAQIRLENYGNFLVATSLNFRLSKLPRVEESLHHLPLYILADTVRIDDIVRTENTETVVVSRRLVATKTGNTSNSDSWRFYAAEVEVDRGSPVQSVLRTQAGVPASAQITAGINQLLDFVEYKAVTTDTFDTRNQNCGGLERRTNAELDSLTPTFSWIKETARQTGDPSLYYRTRLIQQYRGTALEGKLLNRAALSSGQLDAQERDQVVRLLHRLELLNLEQSPTQQEALPDLLKLSLVTAQIIRGQVEQVYQDDALVSKLDLVHQVEKLRFLEADVNNNFSENTEIFRNIHKYWPKENDFEDFRNLIKDQLSRTSRGWTVRNQWINLIHDIESLYQLRNVKFDLLLEEKLSNARRNNFSMTEYAKDLQLWKTFANSDKSVSSSATVVNITIPVVPRQIFTNGEFTQRIWLSDQRFKDFAHLRVHDIHVDIPELTDFNVADHMKIVPTTSILYDINEIGEEMLYTSVPTTYPLRSSEDAVPPFTLWRFVPDPQLVDRLGSRQTFQLHLQFDLSGRHVPGLYARSTEDDACQQHVDNPFEFTDCKYGGEDPFNLVYDIVSVMHLREINQLFQAKYDHQLNGEDTGVVTDISTPWIDAEDGECVDFSDFDMGILNISTRIRMEAVLGPPLMYFPPELPGFMELHYQLDQSVIKQTKIVVNCETDETDELPQEDEPLSGTIVLVVNLRKVYGEVDDSTEKVILDFLDSAITDIDLSYTSIYGKPKLLETFRILFQEQFTATELATIQYDPLLMPPEFVQPRKFYFQTVCEGCTKEEDDDGYLITLFETKSANSVDVQYPKDPHAVGLDRALPNGVYNAGVFLGAHITFCDIYYRSFQGSALEQIYVVNLARSSRPEKPHNQELYILYINDFCIDFGSDILQDTDGVMEIYQKTFQFNSPTRGARATMDNTDLYVNPPHTGRKLARLLAGFQQSLDQCQSTTCHKWWQWMLFSVGCLIVDVVKCIIQWLSDLDYDAWVDSNIAIFGEASSTLVVQPECYSFIFPEMNLDPTVDIQLSSNGNKDDYIVKEDAVNRIRSGTRSTLSLKLTQSPSVSLFSAVNLLFPGQKVIDAKEFFSPGTIVMYGNIVKEYVEQPVFGPDCPTYDPQLGGFIQF